MEGDNFQNKCSAIIINATSFLFPLHTGTLMIIYLTFIMVVITSKAVLAYQKIVFLIKIVYYYQHFLAILMKVIPLKYLDLYKKEMLT